MPQLNFTDSSTPVNVAFYHLQRGIQDGHEPDSPPTGLESPNLGLLARYETPPLAGALEPNLFMGISA